MSLLLSPHHQQHLPARRRSVQWADYTNGGSLTLTKVVSPLPEAYFRSPVRDEDPLLVPGSSSSPTLPNLRGQTISLSGTFNPNRLSSLSLSSTPTPSANSSSYNAFSDDFDADLLSAESRDKPFVSDSLSHSRISSNSALDRAAAWLSVAQRKQRGPIKVFAAPPGTTYASLPSRQYRADEAALLEPMDVPVLQQSREASMLSSSLSLNSTSRVKRSSASPIPSTTPPAFNNSPRVIMQAPSSRIANSPRASTSTSAHVSHSFSAASPYRVIAVSPATLSRPSSFVSPSPLSATLNRNTTLPVSLIRSREAVSPLPPSALASPAPRIPVRSQSSPIAVPASIRKSTQTAANLSISQQQQQQQQPIISATSRSSGLVGVSSSLRSSRSSQNGPLGTSLKNNDNSSLSSSDSGKSIALAASIKGSVSMRPPSPAPNAVLSSRLSNRGPIRATVPLPSEVPASIYLRQGAVPPPVLNSNVSSKGALSTSYLLTHQNRSFASSSKSLPEAYASPANARSSSARVSPLRQAPSPSEDAKIASKNKEIRKVSLQRPVSVTPQTQRGPMSAQKSPATISTRTLSSSEAAFTQSIKSHVERVAEWKREVPPPPPPPSLPGSSRVTIARGKEVQAPRSPKSQQKVPRARVETSRSVATSGDGAESVSTLPNPTSLPPPPTTTSPDVVVNKIDSILDESTLRPSSSITKQVMQDKPTRPQFQVRPLGAPVTGQPLIQTPLRAQSAGASSGAKSSSFASPLVHRVADSPRMSSSTVKVNVAPPLRRASFGSFASPVSAINNTASRAPSPLSTTSLRNAAPIRLSSTLRENKEERRSPNKADKPRRR